jgi:hypothetical protein
MAAESQHITLAARHVAAVTAHLRRRPQLRHVESALPSKASCNAITTKKERNSQ